MISARSATCFDSQGSKSVICVDERMIQIKGCQIMKVYVKNKPVKWGFKSYTLCDSTTAYNCNFELYAGQTEAVGEHGVTHNDIMQLVEPSSQQGHQLYTDHYYTSQALAESLIVKKTELVGTVRSN